MLDKNIKNSTLMGLEPTTFGSEVRRAIHYATEPIVTIIQINSFFKPSSIIIFAIYIIKTLILFRNNITKRNE